MNEKLTALLEQLAVKLGTTADYLWKVLLIQARISATQTLLYFLFIVASGIFLFRLHKKYSKVIHPEKQYDRTIYEENEATAAIMGVLGICWVILFIVSLWLFPNIINGYFNPEYWALDKILDSI